VATPIGTDVVTAISRRYILPDIADAIYNSNPMFYRANRMNKKLVQGGFQIELPIMYSRFAAGGFYSGYDALNIAPSDTVQNAAFSWKQAYVPVTVDGLTLVRVDSPQAIANFLALYFQQAEMELSQILGASLWSTALTSNQLDSIPAAIDAGALASSYGGITNNSTDWQGQVVSATTTMTFANLQTLFGDCTYGGRHPTIIVTNQTEYNSYVALFTATTYYERGPGAYDEILAQGGWTNALFNNIPVVVDSNVPAGLSGGGGQLFMIDEQYFYLIVATGVDFKLEDFITPVNQDAMVAKLFWMGDSVFNNRITSGKYTDIT
jgi:hypothetical protein